MSYQELAFRTPSEDAQEMIIAELDALGFESFVQETPELMKGYVAAGSWSREAVEDVLARYDAVLTAVADMPDQNWNAVWEAGYDSVEVDDFVLVYPEHRTPDASQLGRFRYTLCVQPQMSFGTGHHATTRMMMRQMHDLPIAGMRVLDMGCGTGLLGLLALKMGAAHCDLIDIDEWATDNTRENIVRNGLAEASTQVLLGDAAVIPTGTYDMILANIQKNVLLQDAAVYTRHLKPGGWLLLSGFFDLDGEEILRNFQELGFRLHRSLLDAGWQSLCLHLQA